MTFSVDKLILSVALVGSVFVYSYYDLLGTKTQIRADAKERMYKNAQLNDIPVTVTVKEAHTPDRAQWYANMEVRDKDVPALMKKMKDLSEEVAKLIEGSGIEKKDFMFHPIKTRPVYVRKQVDKQYVQTNEIDYWEADQRLQIHVHDVHKIPALTEGFLKLFKEDARLELETPVFYHSNKREIKDRLVKKAIHEAKAQAEMITETLGVKLKGIRQINIGNHAVIRPKYFMTATLKTGRIDSAPSASSMATSPMEETVNQTVTVLFKAKNMRHKK